MFCLTTLYQSDWGFKSVISTTSPTLPSSVTERPSLEQSKERNLFGDRATYLSNSPKKKMSLPGHFCHTVMMLGERSDPGESNDEVGAINTGVGSLSPLLPA